MSRLEGRLITPTETFSWYVFNGVMFLVWFVLKVLDTIYPHGGPCLTQHQHRPQHQEQPDHQPQLQQQHQLQHQHEQLDWHPEDAEHSGDNGHVEFRGRANSAPKVSVLPFST